MILHEPVVMDAELSPSGEVRAGPTISGGSNRDGEAVGGWVAGWVGGALPNTALRTLE